MSFVVEKDDKEIRKRLIYCHCIVCGRSFGKLGYNCYMERTCEKCGTKLFIRTDETGALLAERDPTCA